MISSLKIKHPLQHHGTSQLERLINALIPENFKIDAHSLQDIIAATHSYAQLIQYYNKNDQSDGDWTCFWEVEPLTFLAIVSSMDTEEIVSGYQQKRTDFNQLPDEEQDEAAENQHALELIEYIRYLAKKVEHFYRLLPNDLPLKREIFTLIRKDSETDTEQLANALHELIGYHKEAYPRTLADPEDLNHSYYQFFFSDHWEIKNPPAFYQIPFSTDYLERGFEKLEDLLKIFHQALVKIKKRANYWFDRNISQPQVREPHVALFLAFLRLFEYAREDLNGLTRQHLEYYYKRVLHLREAPEVPDDVHLIFELANNVDQYMVTAGTELLAGKDKNKQPLIFRTREDWVIGKAKVEELKNSYLDFQREKLFANPDVTKKYCEQEVLPNEKATSWRPMGDDQELPYGEYGFAIASPQLILREGKRQLTAQFYFQPGIPYLSSAQINVYFRSEKEWLPLNPIPPAQLGRVSATVSGYRLSLDDSVGNEDNIRFQRMVLEIILQADFPPIVAFQEPPEEKNISSPWPMLKLTLNQSVELSAELLQQALNIELTEVDLNVKVSGIRENLVIHSDVGVFDGQQEFLPFSAVPKRGKLFRLGSAEAFRKKLDAVHLNFSWIDPPDFSGYGANYVDATGRSINFFDNAPQLKIDFQQDATQIPQGDPSENNVKQVSFDNSDTITTITGVVTDPNGIPLENVQVILVGTDENGPVPFSALAEGLRDTTNSEGRFLLEDLSLESGVIGLAFSAIDTNGKPSDTLRYYVDSISIISETTDEANISVILRPYYIFDMISGDQLVKEYDILAPNVERYGNALEFEEYSPTLPQGFIQVEMVNGDFLHGAYSTALIIKSIALASVEGAQNVVITSANLPAPPYTPATNGISLDYSSNQPIPIGPDNDGIDQFFHVLPFDGYREVKLKREAETVPLFYPYPAHDRGGTDVAPGNLFIGLAELQPGSNLSLLIQMREGSEAEPDWQAPAIRWSYLTKNNQWAPFTAEQILKDTSFGLTRTGMVQLMIPPAIVNETTLFGGELYWLRVAAIEDLTASPPRSPRALPRIVEVRAQVLEARFENRSNDLAHLAQPLPAEQITKLLVSRSSVKKIEQPFPSSNGRLPEAGNEFYRRVSERLRHKDRAVTIWDYERILLQKYPKIYRAKCLSHTHLTSELAPGHVLIAVIPDLQKREDEYPVAPRFSRGDLREMEQYLRSKTNMFVAFTREDEVGNIEEQYLWIVNPIYEPIRLKFDVRFRPGVDVNFHIYVLDDDLKSFLAPWLKDRAADIRFNQPLHRSKIVQFIEERTYVDVVLNLEVEHAGVLLPPHQQEIIPATSRSILTTHVEDGKDPERTDHEIRAFVGGDPAPC